MGVPAFKAVLYPNQSSVHRVRSVSIHPKMVDFEKVRWTHIRTTFGPQWRQLVGCNGVAPFTDAKARQHAHPFGYLFIFSERIRSQLSTHQTVGSPHVDGVLGHDLTSPMKIGKKIDPSRKICRSDRKYWAQVRA